MEQREGAGAAPDRCADKLRDFETMSNEIARDGIEAHEAAVDTLAGAARRAHVNPLLVEVLVDPDQPRVARLRAWSRVLTAVRAPLATPDQTFGLRRNDALEDSWTH
jgi:hypothetical protein